MFPYLVWSLLLTGCLLLTGTFWIFRKGFLVVTVRGESMWPTLRNGDRILVVRRALAGRLWKGAVVVVRAPTRMYQSEYVNEDQTCYVKRLVALSGETFTATVQMTQLEEEVTFVEHRETRTRSWLIPPDHLFVCGDNRERSGDSRIWGPLPSRNVVGVMLLKLTSVSPSDLTQKPFLSLGDGAPPFVARTVKNEVLTLGHYLGQPLGLIFITPPNLSRSLILTCQALVARGGRMFLFVCDTDREKALALVQDLQISHPVLIASRETNPFLQDYHIPGTPAYCFIDASGRIEVSGLLSP